MRAMTIAAPIRQRSWTTVARMFTDGGGSSSDAPNAAATMPIRSAPAIAAAKPPISATHAVHAFHCGPVGVGSTPAGSSGRSSGGAG